MQKKNGRTMAVPLSKPVIASRAPNARMSGPGIVRRQLLLNCARKMLRTTPLAELSLAEVAKRANVPKGSAYFFYDDVQALCASLVVLLDEELQDVLRKPLHEPVQTWQEVMVLMLRRGTEFLEADPAACQLLIGKDAAPALKLIDRANDVVLGRIVDEQIAARFKLPPMPDRPKLFFRAIELADLMYCLSMIEHGKITQEYADEGQRAAIAYLSTYLPEKLPAVKPAKGRS